MWERIALTDVLDFREGPGILAKDFRGTGIPLIRLAGLKGHSVVEGCNFLDEADVLRRWSQFRLRLGDTLLSTSASLGEVATVDSAGVGAIPYTGIISFRPKDSRVAPEFIPLMLKEQSFKDQIEAMGVGSVMKHFGPSHLRHMSVTVPPRTEQQAIAEVLGALDDKIAANTALAATADALIRAEYASLSSRRVRVSEVASSPRSGVDPSLVKPHDLYVGLEHIGRRQMWLADGGEAAEVTSTKSRFEAGDVLFGKLRPYFHKVVSAPRSGICSTDILVVRPKDAQLASLLLAALTSDAVIEEVVSASEGTRMPRTSWKDLAAVEIWWPGPNEVESFTGRLDAVRESTIAVIAENRTLAATRDALLPQLMSGKLRVRDAEEMIAQAGV